MAETWLATPELRWLDRQIDMHPMPGLLEQKWVCVETNKTEWRPVPRVDVLDLI